MRTAVLRLLAGLLAPLFGWVLLTGRFAGRPLVEQVGAGVVAVGFALYAVVGPGPAEWWLGAWFGGDAPAPPDRAGRGPG
jgi:hypothetical protein